MSNVLHFVSCWLVLLAAAASAFGWGLTAERLARMPSQAWPVTVSLGLALLLAIGGVLNVARMAHAVALWLLAGGGLALMAFQVGRVRWSDFDRESVVAAAFIALVVGFAVATQLPPAWFNHHDDLEKYFAHPVRMLATGTLAGSPLNSLGSSALGGMAFLHAFAASLFPIGTINGVDAVFGFGLLLALGAVAGHGRLAPWIGASVAPLLIACIEPQYVNVSALYLGGALMAVAVLLAAEAQDAMASPLALGLLYAGLVALKPTFVLFPLLHLPLLGIAAVAAGAALGRAIRWALGVAAASALALSPWIILYLPNYFTEPVTPAGVVPDGIEETWHLWSFGVGGYGPSLMHYVLLAACGLGAAIACVVVFRAGTEPRARAASIAASSVAGVGAWAALLALAPFLAGRDTHIRLAVPFLLGTMPIVSALALSLGPWSAALRVRAAAAIFGGMSLLFLPSALARAVDAMLYGSILAYLTPETVRAGQLKAYLDFALSEAAWREMRALQERIPAGEAVLVSVSRPFQLDFARNPIVDAEPAGVASYWARIPAEVHYAIWQRDGFGVRQPLRYATWQQSGGRGDRTVATRGLAFARWLESQRLAGEVLYEDPRFVVMRLPPR